MQRILWGIATGVLAATAGADNYTLPEYDPVTIVTTPRPIEDFALVDQNGRDFRFSDLRGQPALILFGFVHCPDVCPNTLLKLRLLKKSGPQAFANVRVVMISIDGDRDSSGILKAYLTAFWPDFIGLTGPPRDVRDIAARFPAAFMKGLPATPGGDYSVQHTATVYAVDSEGKVRAEFSGDTEVDEMAEVVRTLL